MTRWDPFVTTGLEIDDPYSLFEYAQNSQYGDCELRAVLDRNLISCVCRLARGEPIPEDSGSAETYRVAAACMAYLIVADALIDPSISIHELADSRGSEKANRELFAFRIADCLHPRPYCEIALGRATRLPQAACQDALSSVLSRSRSDPEHDLSTQLSNLTKHQASLTKLVVLSKAQCSPLQKMIEFLRWSFEEAFLNAPAITFAKMFLGRKRPRGMIRGVDGSSIVACVRGIRNAAWDLVYLSDWSRNIGQENERLAWILCSRDVTLVDLGRDLCALRTDTGPSRRFALLQEHWDPEEAAAIHAYYEPRHQRLKCDPDSRARDLCARPRPEAFLKQAEEELKPYFD